MPRPWMQYKNWRLDLKNGAHPLERILLAKSIRQKKVSQLQFFPLKSRTVSFREVNQSSQPHLEQQSCVNTEVRGQESLYRSVCAREGIEVQLQGL